MVSGPEAACKTVMPLIEVFAPHGVSYVGDGELARVCKIAHNVMLGVVIENLIEITLLANKMGVPRHAFLAFMNNSVMGSMFTRYKSPALVNLDWTTTFTPELLRKDLDLGLELGREYDVPMPVTAATREVLQSAFRRGDAAARSGGISAEGFRGADGDDGARRRHEAHERKQERADGVGELSPFPSLRVAVGRVANGSAQACRDRLREAGWGERRVIALWPKSPPPPTPPHRSQRLAGGGEIAVGMSRGGLCVRVSPSRSRLRMAR